MQLSRQRNLRVKRTHRHVAAIVTSSLAGAYTASFAAYFGVRPEPDRAAGPA